MQKWRGGGPVPICPLSSLGTSLPCGWAAQDGGWSADGELESIPSPQSTLPTPSHREHTSELGETPDYIS